jgi:hypothetical protein
MAARKRVDPLKAKEAKQKKIAIGGMVLLCLILVVQGPKTLKMLQGPQPVTPTAAPTPAPTTPAPGTPVPGTPVVPPGAEAPGGTPGETADLALVADSDAAPLPDEGDLVTFERFASKDPFAPQAVATDPGAPSADAGGQPAGEKPAGETPAGDAPGADKPVDGGFTPAPGGSGSEPGGGGAPTPTAPTLASLTSISVNGTPEDVEVEKTFPAAEPTFVLVSLAADGKSVEIGVAGGSYANGEQTIKLTLGKPVTLQNTADGSRYELELRAVAGFPLPKPKR